MHSDHKTKKDLLGCGRWTDEEHDSFEEALQKYGKQWKRIAGEVGTRSVVQVRTHAQKYFLKLSRAHGTSASISLKSFDMATYAAIKSATQGPLGYRKSSLTSSASSNFSSEASDEEDSTSIRKSSTSPSRPSARPRRQGNNCAARKASQMALKPKKSSGSSLANSRTSSPCPSVPHYVPSTAPAQAASCPSEQRPFSAGCDKSQHESRNRDQYGSSRRCNPVIIVPSHDQYHYQHGSPPNSHHKPHSIIPSVHEPFPEPVKLRASSVDAGLSPTSVMEFCAEFPSPKAHIKQTTTAAMPIITHPALSPWPVPPDSVPEEIPTDVESKPFLTQRDESDWAAALEDALGTADMEVSSTFCTQSATPALGTAPTTAMSTEEVQRLTTLPSPFSGSDTESDQSLISASESSFKEEPASKRARYTEASWREVPPGYGHGLSAAPLPQHLQCPNPALPPSSVFAPYLEDGTGTVGKFSEPLGFQLSQQQAAEDDYGFYEILDPTGLEDAFEILATDF